MFLLYFQPDLARESIQPRQGQTMNEFHCEKQNRKIGKVAATTRVVVLQPPSPAEY